MYTALYGGRFAVHSSAPFAQALGYVRAPVDSMLVFHIVFGKTVPDISLNAIANLGYAGGRFGVPAYPGDTLSTILRVTGVKQNRDGTTGVVYVHSVGRNQHGDMVVEYARWVMVRKRDSAAAAPEVVVPELPAFVPPASLHVPTAFAAGASVSEHGAGALQSARRARGTIRSSDRVRGTHHQYQSCVVVQRTGECGGNGGHSWWAAYESIVRW